MDVTIFNPVEVSNVIKKALSAVHIGEGHFI